MGKERKTTIIETFEGFDLSPYRLPLIVVYKDPIDFPSSLVARLFDTDRPTEFAINKRSFVEIADNIPASFVFLNPSEEDPPHIVGTFV